MERKSAEAFTVGVCIHLWSDLAGDGLVLNPILSDLTGRISLLSLDQTETLPMHLKFALMKGEDGYA